jgi:hypothetical protein
MATKTAPPNGSGAESRARTVELQTQKTAVAPKMSKNNPKKVQNEGLLASLCALVCDHQLGTSLAVPELVHGSATDLVYRHHHQPPRPPLPHAHILSPREKSNQQVLSNVLLQS